MTDQPIHSRLALLLAALVLAGCAIGRPPATVPAPTPAAWASPLPQGMALPHDASMALLANWWRAQNDPLLVELIEAAQANSPTLASAAARLSEARASLAAADVARLPSLTAVLSASRSDSGMPSGSTGASASGTSGSTGTSGTATRASGSAGSGSSAGASSRSTAVTARQAGLQASWEIDLFGRLAAGADAASFALVGTNARWHQARVTVAADTANLYVGERTCREQLAVARSDAASRAETLRLTDLSMRAGFVAPADAALVRAGAADASGRVTQQRALCDVQRQALAALTGIASRVLEQKLAAAPVQTALTAIDSIASVPAEALAQRPDLFAAELDLAAASASVGEAEALRYPRLTLTGSIATLRIRGDGFKQSLDTWSIGPLSVTVPLIGRSALKANAEAARARYDESAARYRGAVRQAVREVEESLINLDSTARRVDDADAAVRNYQVAFDAGQARYDAGLASLIQLEDLRRSLFATQTSRVALQRERAQAWVSLYRAMGGGWQRPVDSGAGVAVDGQVGATKTPAGTAAPTSPPAANAPRADQAVSAAPAQPRHPIATP